MIRLANVCKKFGARTAVEDLNLEVGHGDIYGLLGHNGAGKSTAIGMMLGHVWPSGGEVRVCGHEVTRHRFKALHKVGAIFETPAFYDFLTGQHNLEILSSYTAPTPRKRIAEVLDLVGLTGREHSRVRTYSHGMRSRLALAQALLPNPELLILDEPADGLDPEGIHDLRATILRLHRELKLTILLSSHLLSEVEQVCTRIAVVRNGRKVHEGNLNEAKTRTDWFKLKLNDFERAIADLRTHKLITNHEGDRIQLSTGVNSDQVVWRLVQSGFSVFEIARHEQTLEDFYLDLMKVGTH